MEPQSCLTGYDQCWKTYFQKNGPHIFGDARNLPLLTNHLDL